MSLKWWVVLVVFVLAAMRVYGQYSFDAECDAKGGMLFKAPAMSVCVRHVPELQEE